MDYLCISGTKGAAYSKSLTKGTASVPSGTNRWTSSVLVGPRGRPIPSLTKGTAYVLYRAKRTAFQEGFSAEWDSVDGLRPEEDGHGLC